MSACAPLPSAPITPVTTAHLPLINCPIPNQHPGWLKRLERVHSNVVLEYAKNPAVFISVLNEAKPVTYYTAPDTIVFMHQKDAREGQVFLIWDDCVEARIIIPVARFKALNEYQGD